MLLASLSLLTTQAMAEPSPEPGGRFFMPAAEIGPVWFSTPKLGTGLMVRTSMDYRFRRLRAPFLRLAYDATTAPFSSAAGSGPSLTANASIHDLLVGGGFRAGSDRLQVVPSLQAGVQLAQLPYLESEPGAVGVGTRTQLSGLVVAGLGAEYFVTPEVALTAEFTGRVAGPFTSDSVPGEAVGFTVGLSTSL